MLTRMCIRLLCVAVCLSTPSVGQRVDRIGDPLAWERADWLSPGKTAYALVLDLCIFGMRNCFLVQRLQVNGQSQPFEIDGLSGVLFLLPPDDRASTVDVVVAGVIANTSNLTSTTVPVKLQPYAPTIGYLYEFTTNIDYPGFPSASDTSRSDTRTPGLFRRTSRANSLDARTIPVISKTEPAAPGETLYVEVYGLGPTEPVVPQGSTVVGLGPQTVMTPLLVVAGRESVIVYSRLVEGAISGSVMFNQNRSSPVHRVYEVCFTVPIEVADGDLPVTIEVDGYKSNTVVLSVRRRPEITSVVNGASLVETIAPGSWFTVRGTGLASSTRTWRASDFSGDRLPTSLDEVSVQVDGRQVPVYFISPAQVNALAPTDLGLGQGTVTVRTAYGTSPPAPVVVQKYAPAFFLFDQANRRYPAAGHPDGTLVGRSDLFGGAPRSSPARPGRRISLYGTGFGPTTPPVPIDRVFSGAAHLSDPTQLSMRIGGVPAGVEFGGLVGVGLYQFNVVVPDIAGGDQPITVEMGGISAQPSVFLTVSTEPESIVRNGDFESPEGGGNYSAGSSFDGWSVERGVASLNRSYQPAQGRQSVSLTGLCTISQNPLTRSGQDYLLRFAAAGDPSAQATQLRVEWGPNLVATLTLDRPTSTTNMGWKYYEYRVHATEATTRLRFVQTAAGRPTIDDVSVDPIPGS